MAGLFSAEAWNKVWTYRGSFLLGLENTAVTALFALLLSLVLGILFGLLATSGKKPLVFLARVYVEVIQNTPVLLQMCFLYYALAFSKFPRINWTGHCMYCSHCAPCPKKIDIAYVTKFLNLTVAQAAVPETVREHYAALKAHAGDCIQCGVCETRCPFGVEIRQNMRRAKEVFGY